MQNSRDIRFGVAVLLFTLGCGILYAGSVAGLSPIFFGSAAFFTIERREWKRQVPRSEAWKTIALVVVALPAIIFLSKLLPDSANKEMEQVIRYPAVIGLLWLMFLWALFRKWRQGRRAVVAEQGAG